jgi:hypothetical protein
MQKYVVFLQENRAEVVSEELKHWLVSISPWGVEWNRKLLEKTGADMTLWAKRGPAVKTRIFPAKDENHKKD